MADPIFTPEELAQVLAYHRPGYVYAAVSELINVAVIVIVLRFCVRPFYALAQRGAESIAKRTGLRSRVLERLWGGPGWGAAILFVALNTLFLTALYLPVDIYFGYINEHRYGLSTHTPASFAAFMLKSAGLRLGARIAVAFGLYGLVRRLPRWWLVLGVTAGTLMLFAGVLDPLRGRVFFPQSPLPDGPLRQHLTALMAKAEIPFADIKVEGSSEATRKVQAYFAGQGPTRTIILGDNLLREFTEPEIVAAVAHEAGHVRENQWPRRIAASVAMLLCLFLIDRLLRLSARRGWFGATEVADIRTLPLVSLTFYVVLTLGGPLSAAVSREDERQADRYAIQLTAAPSTYASMLRRAARINKMDPSPPFWIVLNHSHPPIAERLELVERR